MTPLAVTLPSAGRSADGGARAAYVRALTGEDEIFVLEESRVLWPAARTIALLTRCLVQLGDDAPVERDAVRTLTVGDCDALLLHLRRISFGDAIAAVVWCSAPACGARLDLDLRVSDLLVAPASAEHIFVDVECGTNGGQRRLRLRLPTGGDLEAIAARAALDVDAAARDLLARCAVAGAGGGAEWRPEDVSAVGRALAERDPQADIVLRLTCPECGQECAPPFDVSAFVFREIEESARALYRDVHLLAWRYHWSERDILRLTSRRRRVYVEQIEGDGAR